MQDKDYFYLYKLKMAIDVDLLSRISFFKNLNLEELQSLASVMDIKSYQKDEMIFRLGDQGDSLYIVQDGEVELFVKDHTGEKITLRIVSSGDMFGELSMLDSGPRTADALSIDKSELLALGQDDLQTFLKKHPDAALDLLANLAGRIRQTNQLLMGRVSRNTNTEAEGKMNWVQKAAYLISEWSGSMSFLILNASLFLIWILWNSDVIPGLSAFDPYPFGFLTMSVSLEAIFLSIFVLMSQNLEANKDRIRSNIEYEVNLKAELEISHLHEKINTMNADFISRLHTIEKTLKSSTSTSN